jgi:hypothetical protein
LRTLEAAATPGPWAYEYVSNDDNSWCIGATDPPHAGEIEEEYDEETDTYGEKPEVVDFVCESGGSENRADAALIVEMRNALPALLAAAEATPPAAAEVGALSAERLAEIRTDTNRWDADWQGPYRATRELLAEVDRLTAENARLFEERETAAMARFGDLAKGLAVAASQDALEAQAALASMARDYIGLADSVDSGIHHDREAYANAERIVAEADAAPPSGKVG